MSTKSDFKMFSEMYDNIYNEADLTGEENAQSAIASDGTASQFTSNAPSSSSTQTTGITGPANVALVTLQNELQKLNIIDPTIQQHVQGIATILQNHQPPSTGQGAVT